MKNKGLICDPVTGICEGTDEELEVEFNLIRKKVEVYYFTDPLCSHCWAIDKVILAFKHSYSSYMNFHYVMGGLVKEIDDIGESADALAEHWKDVGDTYNIPIDGSIWTKTPVKSSYPANKVFLTINEFDTKKAELFLRLARLSALVFKKDISNEEVLGEIIKELNLDPITILNQARSSRMNELLNEEFSLAKSLGVRGFPSLVMINEDDEGIRVVGSRVDASDYIKALHKISGYPCLIPKITATLQELLDFNQLLFLDEIKFIFNLTDKKLDKFINKNIKDIEIIRDEILGHKYISLV